MSTTTPYSASEIDSLVARALTEDVGTGDVTTLWTVPAGLMGTAEIRAKAPVVVAGLDPALRVFWAVDAALAIRTQATDGATLAPGELLLTLEGSMASILTAERTALNFLGRLSGIATLTRRFVDAVAGTGAQVVDTRKTTPGWRALEKAAVRSGGGTNHRMGLHDMVLIKENHIAAAGGVEAAVAQVRAHNERGVPMEIEVRTLEELETALDLKVDRILLDNMDSEQLREAVRRTRSRVAPHPLLEASGNVTLDTIATVAATGVDLVSVGALTHSAPVADLSLRVLERGAGRDAP